MALIDVNWNPPRRQLRQFAALFALVFGTLGTVWYLRDRPEIVSYVMWSAAALVALAGAVFPPAVRPVYVTMMAVALPIGFVVSSILLFVIYFLVLTPTGLAMRLLGHDSMGRKKLPEGRSYWIERHRAATASRYFKQY